MSPADKSTIVDWPFLMALTEILGNNNNGNNKLQRIMAIRRRMVLANCRRRMSVSRCWPRWNDTECVFQAAADSASILITIIIRKSRGKCCGKCRKNCRGICGGKMAGKGGGRWTRLSMSENRSEEWIVCRKIEISWQTMLLAFMMETSKTHKIRNLLSMIYDGGGYS